jgi:ABC-type Na+ efflux pump permease subunit
MEAISETLKPLQSGKLPFRLSEDKQELLLRMFILALIYFLGMFASAFCISSVIEERSLMNWIPFGLQV